MAKRYKVDDSGDAAAPGAPAPMPPMPKPVPFVPPAASPSAGPPSAGYSTVPAFDRPTPVIIVGPKPLAVTVEGGKIEGGPQAPKTEKPPEGWTSWGIRQGRMATAGAGTAATAAAGNRVMPGFQVAINGVSNALSALGPKGMVAAAALQTVGTAAGAMKQTIDAFVERGKQLSGYQGNLAASTALADVRRLQTDLREADKLGDQYAKLIEAQSKSDAIISEILMLFKGRLMEMLTEGIDAMSRTLLGILEGINDLTRGLVPGLPALVAEIKRILAGGDIAELERMVDAWVNAANGINIPAPIAPGPRPRPGPGVDFPGMPGF